MYALAIQGPTGVEDHDTQSSPIVPERLYLSQNYPNPFNPMTNIRYGLPEAGHVRLTIYDLRGERITSLVAGQQSAGWHSIIWDGNDQFGEQVSNGVYFYRLVADKYVETRKMVLLK